MTLCHTRIRPSLKRALGVAALGLATFVAPIASAAESQHIANRKAVFAALDKVTARISKLEARLGETVKFGALRLTPRACYSRPPTEPPKTSTFVEINEVMLDGKEKRIFTGWMFAESPGLHALEHPVFDVWLTDCADAPNAPAAQTAQPGTPGTRDEAADRLNDEDLPPHRRFRPRR
ncbi:MAG: DUF2155 domain-containing protein [Hyphomicrobiaceae bacterium]